MARSYHIDIAAHAIGTSAKWVDSVLWRFPELAAPSAGRGVSRAIDFDCIRYLAIIRSICANGVAIPAAVSFAKQLLRSPSARVELGTGLWMTSDVPQLDAHLEARIAESVEGFVPARRGRPRGVKTRLPLTDRSR